MIDWSSATAESLETASAPYLGQWHRLVSTTNWEKGRIISEWRAALAAATAPAGEYADEAWARRVGGVSGQHVGRLRRVAERFNSTRSQFHGLYWSHFQAALDWNDAEMWLEGAVQSRWSVAEMRRQRAETLGGAVEVNSADDALAEDSQAEEFAPGICDPDSATADSAAPNRRRARITRPGTIVRIGTATTTARIAASAASMANAQRPTARPTIPTSRRRPRMLKRRSGRSHNLPNCRTIWPKPSNRSNWPSSAIGWPVGKPSRGAKC